MSDHFSKHDDDRLNPSAPEPVEVVEFLSPPPVDLAEAVFEGESLVSARTLPGPGLIESCGWFFGFLMIHVIAGLVSAVLVLSYQIVNQGIQPGDQAAIKKMTDSLLKSSSFEMIAGEMAIFVVIAIGAALLRTGRDPVRKLGLTPISAHQLLLLVTGAFPLMLFCGGLHHYLNTGWAELLEIIPQLKFLDGTNTNEMLAQFKDGVPLPMLILVIAVCPAIGEELLFRGVIGRGLTARFGLMGGVLVTSCFFAAAHVHPAHALAVLPLGIYVHVAYLSTRSFLAAVLVHFINNAMAAVLLHYSASLENSQLGDDSAQPWWVMVVAGIIAFGTAVTLWKTRLEYLGPRGDLWSPGFATVEVPPPTCDAAVAYRPITGWLYPVAAGSGFFVTSVFLMSLVQALAR